MKTAGAHAPRKILHSVSLTANASVMFAVCNLSYQKIYMYMKLTGLQGPNERRLFRFSS